MDSEERKKLNRLSRKAVSSSATKKRLLRNRLSTAAKSTLKAQKNDQSSSGLSVTKRIDYSLDFFKSCAEMNAVSLFTGEGLPSLQKHLHKVTTTLVQAAVRIMEQHRRGTPHVSDIDAAALSMGLDVPYGAASGELLPVRTNVRNASPGHSGKLFFIRRDKEVDIKTLLRREPTPIVYDVSLAAHWLSIDGVQPASPQNPSPDFLKRMSLLSGTPTLTKTSVASSKADILVDSGHKIKAGASVEGTSHPRATQAAVIERRSHEVSLELMLYFRELTEACVGANENRRHEALDNAAQDTGLQPLLPYLVTFITEGVRVNVTNNNLAILIYLMRLTKALIDNPHISLETHLHLIVPTVITCILCRHLCAKPTTDNHWALRDYAAKQLITLCNRYNTSSNGLYNRISRELYRALNAWIDGKSTPAELSAQDPSDKTSSAPDSTPQKGGPQPLQGASLGMAVSSFNTLYGVLIALSEFGVSCLRVLVFPRLPAMCRRLTRLVTSAGQTPGLDAPTATVLLDKEGGFHQASALAAPLSHADIKSLESLKTLMTNRLRPLLADWRTRQNMPVTPEAYKADYGVMAPCLMPPPPANPPLHQTVTPATSAQVVVKPPQPS